MRVKTRMAPSPTGFLHVGTARTAIFNFLYARHMGGEFILRIEDTDVGRSEKHFEEDIVDGLKWLGIDWDGEITRQSERIDIYEKYIKKLLDEDKAFYCPHSEEELERERKSQLWDKKSPRHVCDARDKKANTGLIRFKNDAFEDITFTDEIRGELSFDPQLLGDFSLAKDLRTPLYNFAVVVDDATMEISHVIRGEDHISNTPKQILLENALGFSRPVFAHLPLILGSDRSKLSKRHGATSLTEYKHVGYLPEAFFNFMAILGWNPGGEQEIFSKEELIKIFSLERVQKAGAIFDITKLDWMNGEYIRGKSPKEISECLKEAGISFGSRASKSEYLEKVIVLEQPRLKKLSELPEKTDYFFKEPEYDVALLKWKQMNNNQIKFSLETAKEMLQAVSEKSFNKENLEKMFLEKAGKDRGELLWPLRVALSGKKASPSPFEIMEILGREESIKRVQGAINKI
ncbi:glutamate--tRNA ligase [Candidatus Giovannonibacteria bacterium RIFCSPHIGHO2_01_FULL_45_33]|uniref:Glutamate--tRNA ligase n=1 Tax=Candidatus Giovannonibacteria bacterium RIFCSPLOWO2_01_FULL_45_34 TaxID=1798351 RepID=A0A1F5WZM2_9BACT|nr:MAG: glutamate--tRNA ligase [Candidatus Giovannonibacteria bacterium RIFCSPHIGHO2_01_FULL_45_33]OGF70264.1 MAG: glutamate--tRNA ligase [Candidatus Giovannonibacteria bacterium RIFCSPHIGHO2_02_FULL_44_11]OGF81105.1 MAG: glutamate--tRNA ligase [Candidatus Giovannonibacteria bacterium RIFCSPLOWO2_01_FULL_45_34]